jgi:hypothetical protein
MCAAARLARTRWTVNRCATRTRRGRRRKVRAAFRTNRLDHRARFRSLPHPNPPLRGGKALRVGAGDAEIREDLFRSDSTVQESDGVNCNYAAD